MVGKNCFNILRDITKIKFIIQKVIRFAVMFDTLNIILQYLMFTVSKGRGFWQSLIGIIHILREFVKITALQGGDILIQMKEKIKRMNRWIIFGLLMIFVLTAFAFASAEDPEGSLAPMNPQFNDYLKTSDAQLFNAGNYVTAESSGDGHPLGLVPLPVDLSHLKKLPVQRNLVGATSLPDSFDLRADNKVTPVKDQGQSGSCWAFATYGSMESDLLMAGETSASDFSENNLKNTHGFVYAHDAGGNSLMSLAYLTRWSGPVNESDDPYNEASGISPSGLTVQRHVQQAFILPDSDPDTVKNALMKYGAVYTSMYMDDKASSGYYNASTHAYFFNVSDWKGGSNHAVTIVGWNDNYSKSNFSHTPSRDGAWIVKNSWGTAWGDNGYFYVSYDDVRFLCENVVFCNAEAATNYDRIYQYDPYGLVGNYGSQSETAWMSNIFTATANDVLLSVGFYASANYTSYEIYVYKDVTSSPIGKTLVSEATTTGTFDYAGFYTVKLNNPVLLNMKQKLSIVVKLTTPGYLFPVPLEVKNAKYSNKASNAAGQSYVSSNGTSWKDMTKLTSLDGGGTYVSKGNVCLKAYTIQRVTITTPPTSQTVTLGDPVTLSVSAIGNPAPTYQWKLNDIDIPGATSSTLESGSITLADAGEYKVVVTNKYDSVTATAKLTVLEPLPIPTVTPDGGIFANAWKAKIDCPESGTTIRYTVDGSDPQTKSPLIPAGGIITITKDTTVKVRAWKTGWAPSPIKTTQFTVTGTVATPTFGLKPGLYKAAQDVTISCTNPVDAADIYYTTDGTEPTVNSLPYTKGSPVHLDTGKVVTIKAKAWKKDWDVSATATATYTITGTVATPELSLGTGTYNGGTKVTATCTTTDAIIRYATGALGKKTVLPTAKSPIIPIDGVVIGNNMSLTVMAFKTNWVNSQPVTANYTIDKVAAPTFSLPVKNYYATPQTVTLSCATTGAKIYYLVGEDDLELTKYSLYKTKISIPKGSTTIRAYAKTTDGKLAQSDVSSVTYLVTGTVPTPTLTPTRTFVGSQTVEMACSPCDGKAPKIRFTVDGTEPTESSDLYQGKITIKDSDIYGPMTFKAKAFLEKWAPSAVASATYTPTVPKPEFDVASGEYESKQIVKITCPLKTGGVTIRYTTGDGKTPPTASSPIVPEDGIVVDRDMTILAAGFRTGWFTANTVKNGDSVAKASYTITKVADPVLSLAPGTYTTPQTVTISCSTPGSAIYYQTENVLTGTSTALKEYKAGTKIPLSKETTTKITARAGMKNDSKTASNFVTATYKVTGTLAAPTFNPGSTTLAVGASKDVTLRCSTMGVNFFYTIDGSTPTIHSLPYTSEGIHVEGSTTIKAITVKEGYVPSPVATAVYTGTLTAPVFDPEPPTTPYTVEHRIKIANEQGAIIRYTTDGKKNPTASSPVVPDNGILVNGSMTIKAQAYKTGWASSAVVTKYYPFSGVATPTFSIQDGAVIKTKATSVAINCATPKAEIYFIANGDTSEEITKTNGMKYSKAITLNGSGNTVIRARAWVNDVASDTGSVQFKFTGTVATPILKVSAGSYSVPQSVIVTCDTLGAYIYYTTNGTEPSATNGTKVSAAIPINTTTTLKVKAFKDEWTSSATVTAVYTLYKVDAPNISPSNNTFNPGQPITLNCGTAGATIRYTTNGNDPSLSDPAVVPGAKINIGVGKVTVKARAWKTGLNPSDIVETTYQVKSLASEELNSRVKSIGKFNLISQYLHAKLYNYLFFGQFVLGDSYQEDSGGEPESVTWDPTPDADGWYTGINEESMSCKMKSPNPGEIYLKTDFWTLSAKQGTDGLWNGTINLETDAEDTYETSSRSNTVRYHMKLAVTFTDADLKQGDGKYQVSGTVTVGKTAYPITASYILNYDAGLSEFHITGSQTFNKVSKTVDEMYLTGPVQSGEINKRINSIQYFNLVQNYIRDKFTNFLENPEHKFEPSGNTIGDPADTNDFDQAWSGPDSDGWYTYIKADKAEDGAVTSNTVFKFKSASANDIQLKVTSTRYMEDGLQLTGTGDLTATQGADQWDGVYNASYDTVLSNKQIYHTNLVERFTNAALDTGAGTYDVSAAFQIPGEIASYYSLTANYTVGNSRAFTANSEELKTCENNQLSSDEINRRLDGVKSFDLILSCMWDKIDHFMNSNDLSDNSNFKPSGEALSLQGTPSFVWVPDSDGWYKATKETTTEDEATVDIVLMFKSSSAKEINLKVTRTEMENDGDGLKRPGYYVLSVTKGEKGWNGSFTANGVDYTEIDDKDRKITWTFSEPITDADLATGDGTYNGIKANVAVAYSGIPPIVLSANYTCAYDPETQKVHMTGNQTFKFMKQTTSNVDEYYTLVDSGSSDQINSLLKSIQKVGLLENYLSNKFACFLGENTFAYRGTMNSPVMSYLPLSAGAWVPDASNSGHYIGTSTITSNIGGIENDYTLKMTYWQDPDQYHNLTVVVTKKGASSQLGSLTVKAISQSDEDDFLKGSFTLSESGIAGYNAQETFNISLSANFTNANLAEGTGSYTGVTATFVTQSQNYNLVSNYDVTGSHNQGYFVSGNDTFNGATQTVSDGNFYY